MAEMNNPQLQGTIQSIEGNAWLRKPDGSMVVLKVGDHVNAGDIIVTGHNAHVELARAIGASVEIGGDRTVLADQDVLGQSAPDKSEAAIAAPDTDADRIIAALNDGQDPFAVVDPAAAGLVASGDNDGHGFVRLLRIVESVTPGSFNTTSVFEGETIRPTIGGGDDQFEQTQAAPVTPSSPTSPESISLSSITADNIINASEAGGVVPVTGTVGPQASAGDGVTLTIGGNTYTGTVQPDHTFSINVPGSVLATNSNVTASVTTVDAAGISASATTDHAYGVDTLAAAAITVASITADNIVNAAEAGGTIAVTGTVGGDAKPGDTVTLTVGGNSYTGTVAADNTYSIGVPGSVLAGNNAINAAITTHDAAGNTATASAVGAYAVDLAAAASITLNAITADNVINANEASGTVPVTGSVGGDAKPGDTVTLTVGGNTYVGTVTAGNNFSINVPGSVLAANGNVGASVTSTDGAGNTAVANATHSYGVDTSATAGITVNSITADNVINATESGSAIAVTGTVSGDAKPGDTVTLSVGGNTYSGVVGAGNAYSINVPGSVLAANASVGASVTAVDAAGNTTTVGSNHAYGVDTTATATISVDSITADNVINATEAGGTVAVTGSVGGDAKPGDSVTLTVGGNTYVGTVAAGNTYSINVPGSVLGANASVAASITATDPLGNTASSSATHAYTVDTSAAANITVASITADNIVNAAEAGGSIAVTGSVGGDAKPGDTVTLSVGGHTYTGTVAGDNSYGINVPGSVLATNSAVVASVAVTDPAGNTATASANHPYSVDTTASATITVDNITADNIVNAAEAGGTVAVTGTVGGDAKVGDVVTLSVGGNTYTGTVTSGNAYSIDVPGSVLAGNSNVATSVAVTDPAGNTNTATASHPYVVDTIAGAAITIDNITADNIVNAVEAAGSVAVTGNVGGDVKIGDTVTLVIGGNTYTGLVTAGNAYSINVPGSVLAANSTVDASVTGTDSAGNSLTIHTSQPYNVDTVAAAGITVDPVTADNVVNATESGSSIAVTGVVGGDAKPGDTVTLTVGSHTYTGTVTSGNAYSINVPGSVLAANSTVSASVTATDAAGNTASASASHPYSVDTTATASITVDAITSDNVVNASESAAPVAVTGTVAGDAKVGDTVTLTVGSNTYTGTVAAGNTYSINVPGSILAANASVSAAVTATDAAGNTASASAAHPYGVDTAANATISVDNITADNVVNAAESGSTIAVTGTVGGDAKTGDTVTLTVGSSTYTGTVTSGNAYSINVPGSVLAANGSVSAKISVSDAAGNTATADANHPYTVDTAASASITVDPVTSDNVINASEAASTVPVTGTVGGDAKPGDTVTLTVGGNIYTGTVVAGNTYSINVPGSVLAANSNVHATVSASDAAGNTATAAQDHGYSSVLAANATVNVNAITADNVINATEAGSTVPVTGTVGGVAHPGDVVTLTVGGNTYTGTVLAGNTFSINVPGSVLAADTHVLASVASTDSAGNAAAGTDNHVYAVDTVATAAITIASITADNILNAAEAGGTVAVTGTVGGDAKIGDTVTLSVGGNSYTGTVTSGNAYSINVPGSVLATDSNVSASVTAHDAAGNTANASAAHAYSVNTSATASITVASVTADNIVNATETGSTIAITGTVGGDAKTGDTVTLSVGGNTYTGTVTSGNAYSINVPGSVLAANSTIAASVAVTDPAGNTATASANHPYAVDTLANASITIDSITSDNVINASEAASTVPVTGSVGGDAKPGDTVTLTVGGNAYTGTVASGNTYSINVPGSVLAANSNVHATVSASDAAGNTASAAQDHAYTSVLAATASVHVDSITADNVINATEAGSTVPVTGTVGGVAHPGDTVTLTVGGNTYTGTVLAGNTFSINVPGSVLAGNASVGASVTSTDSAGNSATGTDTHAYAVDTVASASITVASITADNIINAAEAGGNVAVTGTVGGDAKTGDTVSLIVGSNTYTGTVAAGGTYSISVPGSVLASNSTVSASVTATDAAGNTASASAAHPYGVDTTANATITVASITADNVINAAEAGATVAVTGTVGGDARPGDTVTLTVGGNTYTGAVSSANAYSINVPGSVLAANSTVSASVTATDAAGNTASATAAHPYAVNTTATATITVASITADNIINATEAGGTVAVAGTVGGDAKPGDTVMLTVGSNSYTGTVGSGNAYSINVPGSVLAANSTVSASVTATDAAGNTASASAAHPYGVNTTATATITVASITADNIINATEAGGTVAVTGTVGGDAKTGDTVSLTVGGNTYTGTVTSGNAYSINVPGSVLAANSTVSASVSVSDAAGNTASASANHPYSVDTTANASITVDPITSDNVVNASEAASTVPVTGTVGGDAKPGDTVTLTVGGNTYTGAVASGNTYSINVPGSVLAANSTVHAVVTATDAAGNTATATQDHGYSSVLAAAATIHVDPVTADNVINATEAGGTVAVTGTVGGVAHPGDGVTLSIGGNTYTGTVLTGNTFSINVPGSVLAGNTAVIASVTGTDSVGNSATGTDNHAYAVDTTATIAITNTGTGGDGIYNKTESGAVTITGTTSGVENGRTVTVTFSDGTHSVTDTASISGGTWTLSGTPANLASLSDGPLTISAQVSDVAGNSASTSTSAALDTVATASISVAAITADNIINATEAGSTIAVTGTVGGDAKVGDTVTLTVGSNTYAGTVASGNTYSINVAGSVLATDSNVSASVTAHDAAGNAATSSVSHAYTVDFTPINSVPAAQTTAEDSARVFSSANGNAITVAEADSSATLTTTLSVTHGALHAVTFVGATISGNDSGTVTISGSAAAINGALNGLAYTNTADYNGSDALKVVTAGGSLTDTDTIGITITPVGDIANDTVTTNEDTPVNINVNANDSFENAAHAITAINGTAIAVGGSVAVTNGSVTLKADGTVDFNPSANYNGPASFTYTVSSGGTTETATVNITVVSVNDAPVAGNDTGAVNEDASLAVSAANGVITSTAAAAGKDTDVDGDALSVSAVRTGTEAAGTGTFGTVGSVLHGTYGDLTLNSNGSYTYAANNANALSQGVTATDTFTYTVSDGQGGTDQAELAITVTGTNDVPVTVGSIANLTQADSTAVSIATAGKFSDPDSADVLTYSASGLPTGLTMNASTGVISGTLDHSASQGGTAGAYAVVVTANDGHGGTVNQTFTLSATNLAPVANNDVGAVNEDASVSVTAANGVITSSSASAGKDVDPDGDTLTVSAVRTGTEAAGTGTAGTIGSVLHGAYGDLTLNSDGSYTYVANNANALSQGVKATDTFTYTVSDGQGGTDKAELAITVTGTNDVPVTVGSIANLTQADSTAVSIATAGKFSDPDSTDVLTYSASGLPTGLTINASTGVISGTLDHSASQGGTAGAYTVVVTANDGHGGTVNQTFTLSATNPAPTANNDVGAVNEDATLSVTAANGVILSGSASAGKDVDPDGDTLSVSAVRTGTEAAGTGTSGTVGNVLHGIYGDLTLFADGHYTYVANNANALSQGVTATDTFTYTVSDGQGGTDKAELAITITGMNDVPVTVGTIANLTQADSTAVSIATAGKFSDVDSADVLTYSASGLPTGLTINASTGVISGTLDHSASQGGTAGAYSIVVTANDGHGGTVNQTFTLSATNPAPIANNDVGAVNEDATLSVTAANGVITSTAAAAGKDTDPDGDTLSVSAVRTGTEAAGTGTAGTVGSVLHGTYGDLTLFADGHYTYVANNANSLSQGVTATDTFTYTVSDGQGGTDKAELAITVTGTNDVPVTVGSIANLTQADSTAVSIATAGKFSDPDSADVLTYSATGLPTGLTINASTGIISGTLDHSASQGGGTGGSYSVVVTANDGHGGTVNQTFTLSATNPAPVANNDTGTVNEDASVSVTAANGVITSTAAASGKDTDPDGDALSVTAVRTGTEAAGTGTAGTVGSVLHGTYGDLTLNSDGSYTYVANNANSLSQGVTATDTFTYTVSDGQGGTDKAELAITVTGTNDVPVTVGTIANLTQADSTAVSIATAGKFSDPDSADVLTYSASGLPTGLSINASTGVISGTLDHSASQGGTGGSYSIVVTANDGHGGTVNQTFSLAATNPPPTANNDIGAVSEDATLSVTAANGVITSTAAAAGKDTDVDGDALSVSAVRTGTEAAGTGTAGTVGSVLHGTYGDLTLNSNGSYTYAANNANALSQGVTATDTFTYTVSDGQGGTDQAELAITVTGTNDVPVTVGSIANLTQADSTAVSIATAGKFSDPDSADVLTYSASGLPTGLTINASTGVISGTLDHSASQGGTGGSYSVVVTANDGHGGTVNQTFTLSATNPAPVANNDVGTVNEDATLSVTAANGVILSGSASAGKDVDPDGDTLTVSAVRTGTEAAGTGTAGTIGSVLHGAYGDLTLNSDGSYTYVANNANALSQGVKATDTFTYTVSDGQGGTDKAELAITVTGTNDVPVTVGTIANLTQADSTAVSIATSSKFSDPDSADVLTYSASGLPTGLTINASTGVISGTLDHSASQGGTAGAYTVVVTANDGHGGTVNQTFTLSATNPAPIANNDVGAVGENSTLSVSATNGVILSGSASAGKDVDPDGDTLTVSAVRTGTETGSGTSGTVGAILHGAYGDLTLNADGSYAYVANNAHSLAQGVTATDTFTYTLSDGQGGTDKAELAITITGTNDAPVIDLDANNSTASNADFTTTYTENAAGVSIADTDINITDVDSANLAKATITLTNAQAGDVLAAGSMPAGITATVSGNVVTLTGSASLASYQTAIHAVTYASTSENPSTADRAITVVVNDGISDSNTATATVHVVAVNDAPVATGSTISGTEDTALALTWANFNVTDVDGGPTPGVKITSLPADGVIQYNNSATSTPNWVAVTVNQVITQTDITAGKLQFVPDHNESGSSGYSGTGIGNMQHDYASFTFQPTDGSAANGTGATATIKVDITPVADTPILTHNAAALPTAYLNLPAATGLTRDYYQAVSTLTDGPQSTAPGTMEAGLELIAPTSSSVITNVGVAGTGGTGVTVAIDDAYRVRGLVYMEAGSSYVFSGYADDTSRLEIGGNTLMSGQWGVAGQASAGNFTANTFTPAVSGFYSLEFFVYNTSGPGSYELNVSVNGAAAVDVSTANMSIYQSIGQLESASIQHSAFVPNTTSAEGGYYPVAFDAGYVNTAIHIAPIVATLTDTDGSETQAVTLQSIPVGAVLTDTSGHSFTATAATTSINVTGWDLAHLSITPPSGFIGSFDLTAVETSTETVGGDFASALINIHVTVAATGAITEIDTYNPDSFIGRAGDDQFIAVSAEGTDLVYNVSLGAYGSTAAVTGQESSATANQQFSTGAGNDYVEAGAGNDTIYLGDSGTANHPVSGALPTQTEVAATNFMTIADSAMVSAAGVLTGTGTGQALRTDSGTGSTHTASVTTWADVAHGGSGNDIIHGGNGTDLIYGGLGNDTLYGDAGDDGVRGGAGDDIIIGGQGNDVLRGDAGSDTFKWQLGDQGTTAAPARDTILDFSTSVASGSKDVLDLKDLLVGETHTGNAPGTLTNYLHFEVTGGNTVVHVSTTGGYSSGFVASKDDQTITLTGVTDITNGGNTSSDSTIIADLLTKGKLITD